MTLLEYVTMRLAQGDAAEIVRLRDGELDARRALPADYYELPPAAWRAGR